LLRWAWATFQTVAATILCVSLAGFAVEQQALGRQSSAAESEHREFAKRLDLSGVRDFGEVTPTLYRGTQPNREGFEQLAKMGVKIVVDLRGDRKSERTTVEKLGMIYEPIAWFCMRPKDRLVASFLNLIRDNPGKKIFVHCTTGIDRTGMMVAAYRMADQGWTAQEAMAEMKAFGFSRFHETICLGLSSYEAKFPHEFETAPEFKTLREAKSKQQKSG
jgi:tyrosine-protein phosphatase SIW14